MLYGEGFICESLHDVRAVGCGDEDVQIKDYIHVVCKVRLSIDGLQISVKKTSDEAKQTLKSRRIKHFDFPNANLNPT